jgi:hypothetical protein
MLGLSNSNLAVKGWKGSLLPTVSLTETGVAANVSYILEYVQ